MKQKSEFLNYFGKQLATALFLGRKLSSLDQVGVIDQPEPQDDHHTLESRSGRKGKGQRGNDSL
ncbi:MAG: hypothetical protein ABSG85_12330 [Spirochaetia bacterium]|jgi:hypothetical protein